ncbi:MAG: response regulator transcription factor [Halodesulfurarchaeum sp.]
MGEEATIQIVEDDPGVRQLHERWLRDDFEVRSVADGESAIECATEAVDVFLLDRNLPGITGDQVARALRSEGYSGMIAMVTANDPDEVVGTLPIDEYVTKPIDKSALTAVVERLLARLECPPVERELLAMLTRKHRLESASNGAKLATSETYENLLERIETHCQRVDWADSSRADLRNQAGDLLRRSEPLANAFDATHSALAPREN